MARKRFYRLLGIDESASCDQVKAAFRKVAKKTHPDVSRGNGQAFDEARHAYVVLSDPIMRQKYDATGDEGLSTPNNSDAEALNVISGLIAQIASIEPERLISNNLLVVMRDGLQRGVTNLQGMITPLEKAEHRTLAMRTKFKRKKPGENPLDRMIEAHMSKLALQLVPLKAQLAAHVRAREILDEYEYTGESVGFAIADNGIFGNSIWTVR